MIIRDTPWDDFIVNGRSGEIYIDESENLPSIETQKQIESLISDYKYLVCKVPAKKVAIGHYLENSGFRFIESQLSIEKMINVATIDPKLQLLVKKVESKKVETIEDVTSLCAHIEPGMFETDRISLDPELGFAHGARRYQKWLRSLFDDSKLKNAEIHALHAGTTMVGFFAFKIENDHMSASLGGLFPAFKGLGIGASIVLKPLQIATQKKLKYFRTQISSNNVDVAKLYFHLGFNVTEITYVFRYLNKTI